MKINQELRDLIPPLTVDEKQLLTDSLISEGCRDAIITWDGIIVDGHNRYEICTANNLPFDTIEKDFSDISEVKMWMINNQKGRRNLTDGWKFELAQIKKAILLEKGRAQISEAVTKSNVRRSSNPTLSIVDKDENLTQPHNTRTELANDLGWSTGKVAMADKVWNEATPEIKEKIKSGETTFNQAYKEIKKEAKKDKLEQKKEEYKGSFFKDIKNTPQIKLMDCMDYLNTFANDSIDAIITDPPYMTDVEDIELFVNEWLPLAISKTKKQGRLYICTGPYPKEIQAYLNVLLSQDKYTVDNPLIWAYKNTLGQTPKMKYNLNYQMIWHLYSSESPELDTGITNHMFSVQEINAPDGRQGNRLHTWQKPDELANRLIVQGTKENDLVVDCFACTGTFLLAASKYNRTALGCDNNLDNLKIAEERGCEIV